MDQVQRHALDTAIASVSGKATYTGASMSVFGWFVSSEFAVLVGTIVGVAGFFVNWYYRHKLTYEEIRLKRESAERERTAHEALMRELK
jgi:Bacteriophage holin family, superfamily II-like